MVRDAAARQHVERVEAFVDYLATLDEWKRRLNRDIDTLIAMARQFSPDRQRVA